MLLYHLASTANNNNHISFISTKIASRELNSQEQVTGKALLIKPQSNIHQARMKLILMNLMKNAVLVRRAFYARYHCDSR
jgi:hypothetical protein